MREILKKRKKKKKERKKGIKKQNASFNFINLVSLIYNFLDKKIIMRFVTCGSDAFVEDNCAAQWSVSALKNVIGHDSDFMTVIFIYLFI